MRENSITPLAAFPAVAPSEIPSGTPRPARSAFVARNAVGEMVRPNPAARSLRPIDSTLAFGLRRRTPRARLVRSGSIARRRKFS